MDIHNRVAKLCLEHFNSVVPCGKFKSNEWTVLSCIVADMCETMHVVATGTGSKCIGRNKMSNKGDILNDSHAEVICRRVFLRYLYEQMLQYSNSTSDVFIFDESIRKFKLKEGIKFHFFTTHVPCGDAAIFPKQCAEEFGEVLVSDAVSRTQNKGVQVNCGRKRPNDDSEGGAAKKPCVNDIYRTGAKCLTEGELQDSLKQGATYHVTGAIRTKPGRGDPTLSVSCSDKIARWCSVGMQGALMSLLLAKPIYFSTFTIAGGTPFSKEASDRAFYDRISNLHLTQPYKVNKMETFQAAGEFKYAKSDGKIASPISIMWLSSSTQKQMEVSVDGRKQGVTKKKINSKSVRVKICKVELFKHFVEVIKKCNIDLPLSSSEVVTLHYQDVKNLAKNYQDNWMQVKKTLKTWTKKDQSCVMFFYGE